MRQSTRLQCWENVVKRPRATGVVTLCIADPQLMEQGDGLVVLYELRDRLRAESAGDVHDGFDENLVCWGLGEARDEFPVDLDVVEFEVPEVVEGGEPGAEVVKGEATSQRPEVGGELASWLHVRDRDTLGELEHKAALRDRVGLQQHAEVPADRPRVQRLARHVD